MASKRHILKPGDGMSHEEYLAERQHYTDEQARKLGYPSVEVLRLSDRLTQIAGQWRRTKDDSLVREYREVLYSMILKGYDVETLPIQDQLPPRLMPELPPPTVQAAIKQAYRELSKETE